MNSYKMEQKQEETLYFTKEHIWARIIDFAAGLAQLGLSSHALENFGEVVYVDLPLDRKNYRSGAVLGVVESSKIASDIYFPFDCKVLELNSGLVEDPSLLNRSPMELGWLVKVQLAVEKETGALMNKEKYKEYTEEGSDEEEGANA